MGKMKFVWGDRQAGYRLRTRRVKGKDPWWEIQIWFEGRIVSRDSTENREAALKYIDTRKRIYYGSKLKRGEGVN